MKLAHFSHVWGKPGMSPHARYEQLWREIELCDTLGYDYAFCVEHHFRPDESWMSAPSLFTAAAGVRTKNIRLGPMGYIVPLYGSLRLAEEIALLDQMLDGRLEVGLVPGVNPLYFESFGLDYDARKAPTMEYIDYLAAALGAQPFSFEGTHHRTAHARLAVMPKQQPHPPLWMQSRDRETLRFCAAKGLNTGYFLVYPRSEAAPRYRQYLADWDAAGWSHRPNIAYSTVVYVDESDDKALDVALARAGRAYEGFLSVPDDPSLTFEDRVAEFAALAYERGEGPAADIRAHLFDAEYLHENDLVFIGSAKTVTEKLMKAASEGVFNCFMGEFNFSDLPEDDLMRSIRLFGEQVMPELQRFEPF